MGGEGLADPGWWPQKSEAQCLGPICISHERDPSQPAAKPALGMHKAAGCRKQNRRNAARKGVGCVLTVQHWLESRRRKSGGRAEPERGIGRAAQSNEHAFS
jgi:hypothetical protein